MNQLEGKTFQAVQDGVSLVKNFIWGPKARVWHGEQLHPTSSCATVSVTGPGRIYRLRFRASNTPQATMVRFLPGLRFYDAGLYVTPVTSSAASIGIGMIEGVDEPRVAPPVLRVSASPNPALAIASLRIEADRAGMQDVRVLDSLGRVVRRLEKGSFAAGARMVSWNRRSADGKRVPAGHYTVEVRSPEHTARTRLVLLP